MSIPTVGLTGGIATGKSTAAGYFAELGIPVVDADQIAREIVDPGSEALDEIVAVFGEEMLKPDGTLHRERLGELAFRDADARTKLNAITHPRIAQRSMERLGALGPEDAPYAIYEAALLVENGAHRAFPSLVVVTLPPELQLARLMERDHIQEAQARARINAQMPLAQKEAVADFVISNKQGRDHLRQQVQTVHRALLAKFGAP
ncbi:MAG: dephospho-CoA kinase [Myxococcales bacterium]|nr:dephospho-CoA kinase [Myxococcales bacterium]